MLVARPVQSIFLPLRKKRINLQHLDGYERGFEGREMEDPTCFHRGKDGRYFSARGEERGVWKRVERRSILGWNQVEILGV